VSNVSLSSKATELAERELKDALLPEAQQDAAPQTPSKSKAKVPSITLPEAELFTDTPLLTTVDEKRVATETSSRVLEWPRDVKRLQPELPARCADRNWELLYSTVEHGISINTFFRKVRRS
jgi:hypothetical protein